MKIYAALASILLLSAPPVAAKTAPMTDASTFQTQQACEMKLDFKDTKEVKAWRPVLDGVMGGKSTGVRFAEDAHMSFKGIINTNGGGFSSIRRSMELGDLAGAESVKLRIKHDGRAYRLTFRTGANYWGRPVSYQLDIPQTPKGVWTDVTLPLENFQTSIFGRRVRAPRFNPADVWEMGIILADGIDGPFEINIGSVACG